MIDMHRPSQTESDARRRATGEAAQRWLERQVGPEMAALARLEQTSAGQSAPPPTEGENMQLRTMMDTANPNAPLETCDVAGGYIGGRAEHVWSRAQWHAQTARFRLPIWVADPAKNGTESAHDALAMLSSIGCPLHVTVALDLETLSIPGWVDAWGHEMHQAQFLTMPYGSTSTLFTNPPRSGYWVAHPTDGPHLYEHPLVLATQWALDVKDNSGQICDKSVIRADVSLWDTRPTTPPTLPAWERAALTQLHVIDAAVIAARKAITNR